MKKFGIFTIVSIALIIITSTALASGIPGSGWWTGETIQNIGASSAAVQVVAYDKNSSSTYSASTTIDSGKNYTFTPTTFSGMPDGFQGSAVVSADQPIKAIVTITNRESGTLGVSGGQATGIYQGFDASAVDSTLYFPIAKGDAYSKTTSYYVQNAGSADTTLTATFKMKNGDTHTYNSPTIQPNKMVVFNVYDTPTYVGTCTPVNTCRVGAVTVVSDNSQPLAGTHTEHKTVEDPATLLQSTRGFTSSDFDTKLYVPVTKNDRFDRFTGIQVQNVTAATPIDITVTYLGVKGTCTGSTYVDTQTGIQPGANAVFNQLLGQTNLPVDCMASATVETTTTGGQIVALVSESYMAGAPYTQASVTSFAMPDNQATTKVVGPQFKDDRFEKRTGFTIQNVGTATATNVVATFNCAGGSTFTAISNPLTIPVNGSIEFNHPVLQTSMFTVANPFSASNVTCSVTVTSDQPIVALAAEFVTPGATLLQDKSNYEGINLSP
jgi:hypothetical protein